MDNIPSASIERAQQQRRGGDKDGVRRSARSRKPVAYAQLDGEDFATDEPDAKHKRKTPSRTLKSPKEQKVVPHLQSPFRASGGVSFSVKDQIPPVESTAETKEPDDEWSKLGLIGPEDEEEDQLGDTEASAILAGLREYLHGLVTPPCVPQYEAPPSPQLFASQKSMDRFPSLSRLGSLGSFSFPLDLAAVSAPCSQQTPVHQAGRLFTVNTVPAVKIPQIATDPVFHYEFP